MIYRSNAKTLRSWGCPGVSDACRVEIQVVEKAEVQPWYKVATARAEVREGRSFHPDEFAIALEQVIRGTAQGGCDDCGR